MYQKMMKIVLKIELGENLTEIKNISKWFKNRN